MSQNWWIGVMMLFIMCTIGANIVEQSTYVITSEQAAIMQAAGETQVGTKAHPEGGEAVSMELKSDFFTSLRKIIWWDYSFFGAEWDIVKWIFFRPLSIGTLIALALVIRRIIG